MSWRNSSTNSSRRCWSDIAFWSLTLGLLGSLYYMGNRAGKQMVKEAFDPLGTLKRSDGRT